MFKFVLIFILFAVSCQRESEIPAESPDYIADAGKYHNMYLDEILNHLDSNRMTTRTEDITAETFIQEMAKIQSAVLTNTNLKGMSREQIISHIQRNINVSISPNVISLAKSLADNPDVSALNELNKNGDLSPVMSAYVSEVDKILTTSTLSDASRSSKLDLAFTKYYRQADNNDRKLISATHDIFKDSKDYWEKNGATWERSIGKYGSLKSFLWGVARADGWALVKAVYSAGWYYATMFWKEMLIASGVASAVSAVATIIREIGTSSVNGEILYSINGSEPISESVLKEMIFQEIKTQNPELNLDSD